MIRFKLLSKNGNKYRYSFIFEKEPEGIIDIDVVNMDWSLVKAPNYDEKLPTCKMFANAFINKYCRDLKTYPENGGFTWW